MNVISIQSDVNNGELEPEKLAHLLRGAKAFEGKRVSIVLKKHVKTRSGNQNRFLHGVFFLALQEGLSSAGVDLSLEQVKEFFKERFGEIELIAEPNGDKFTIPKSTATYTAIEMERAMEKARAHFAPWFPLPFPNEGDL
jgi:hypothetical protein